MRKAAHSFAGTAFVLCLTVTIAQAQTTIRGSVLDDKKNPLSEASVLLLQAKDSALVKGSVTTKSGQFVFDQVATGNYLVQVSYSGFKNVYQLVSPANTRDNLQLPAITVSEKESVLQNLTVSAKKPLFEQQIDRMVINVSSSITNAGSTALDILMRSPGIIVNQQNNSISMSGKEGVSIMLNGKLSRMPIEALVQMLAGMSSANIEKIELITTPPANFDAEGNAGFINIVLKKNSNNGTNGSLSVTGGYGLKGGPVTAGSFNLNHRVGRWNIFGDYSFYRFEPSVDAVLYRKVMNGAVTTENRMHSLREDFRRNHNGRIGIDFDAGRKTVIGLLLSGFSNMYGMEAVNRTMLYANNVLDTVMQIDNPERHPLDNYSINLNLQQQLRADERLTLNVDRMYYKDVNTLDYFNQFFRGDGSFIYSDKTRSFKETPIRFWVVSADYNKRLSKKADLESGVKTTFSSFINDVLVERGVQNNWVADPAFTSKHNLEEKILAAYTSLNFHLGAKTSAKAGLRYEYTTSNLGSETVKNIVDRKYGNLFPTFFLSHTISEKSTVNLSYNRRITRPTFNNMAPFVYFVDPNTFFSGNAALQPATANSVKGDFILKRAVFSLSYTAEKNTITNFTPQVDPASNKQTLVAENQKGRKLISASITLPITVTGWWNMQNNLSGNKMDLDAQYKGAPLSIKALNLVISSTQSFTLPQNFTTELSAFYLTGGMFGIYQVKPFASLNFGLQKKLSGNGGALSLNITDVSGPPRYRGSIDAPEHNLVTNTNLRFAVTTFKLTYTRRFGNNNIKEGRKRVTGSEEEKQRVQTN
ncbi:TonB-dependent receptor [Flavisolibacter sp. BT320]|nr:TonB-dependent receptor [Flavisolibacter longurius]